jgi:hypothetical protein
VTCKNTAGIGVPGVNVRIENTSGGLLKEGTTNSSGIWTDSFTGSNQDVNVVTRKRGYKYIPTATEILGGLAQGITMIRDTSVNRI